MKKYDLKDIADMMFVVYLPIKLQDDGEEIAQFERLEEFEEWLGKTDGDPDGIMSNNWTYYPDYANGCLSIYPTSIVIWVKHI